MPPWRMKISGCFFLALGDVAEARGLIPMPLEEAEKFEKLWRDLSPSHDPEFSTLVALLRSIGLRIKIRVDEVEYNTEDENDD